MINDTKINLYAGAREVQLSDDGMQLNFKCDTWGNKCCEFHFMRPHTLVKTNKQSVILRTYDEEPQTPEQLNDN